MLAGLAASTALAAAMAVTHGLLAFLVLRFLAGLASAFVMIFLTAIVFSHLAVAGRSDLQAVHFAGVGSGIAISSVMMALLVSAGAHWPAGWLASGAISLAGFVAVILLIDRGPAASASAVREPALPRSSALMRLILAYGVFGFGYIVTATFLIAIIRQGEGGRLFETLVWLATGLAAAPSIYAWAGLARRRGPTEAFALCLVVEAVGVAASVTLGGRFGPLLGGILLGGTFVAATAYGLQAGRMLAPASSRRALALMTAAFGIGQIVGPIVAGLLAQQSGSYVVPSAVAALALLGCAAIVWPTRRAGISR